jgi:hypothetical protein
MESAARENSKTTAIAAVAELSEEAAGLATAELRPGEYVALLVEKGLFADAVRFLAHALPKREAVWWAWVCARRAAGDTPPPKIGAALAASEKWIAQPNEDRRRAAMAAAEAAGFNTPAGCAALAAFFSGGSLAPPNAPVVPPGEHLTAKAVAGAVIMAAVSDPAQAPEKFRASVTQGLDVTARIKLWEQ